MKPLTGSRSKRRMKTFLVVEGATVNPHASNMFQTFLRVLYHWHDAQYGQNRFQTRRSCRVAPVLAGVSQFLQNRKGFGGELHRGLPARPRALWGLLLGIRTGAYSRARNSASLLKQLIPGRDLRAVGRAAPGKHPELLRLPAPGIAHRSRPDREYSHPQAVAEYSQVPQSGPDRSPDRSPGQEPSNGPPRLRDARTPLRHRPA